MIMYHTAAVNYFHAYARCTRWRENGGKLAITKMSERRSSRQKRTIDYRQFAERDTDDDDDFETSPMVPARKGRGTEPTQNGRAVEPQKPNKDLTKKPRLSRDERRFDKDTEKALMVSKETVSNTPHAACDKQTPLLNSDQDYQPSKQDEECEEDEEILSGSDSDFSDVAPPKKKNKTTKPTKTTRKVCDVSDGKTTKTVVHGDRVGKKKDTSHSTTAQRRTKIEKPASVASPNTPKSKISSVTKSSSLVSSPGLGMRRIPSWTPPGPAVKGDNAKGSKTVIEGSGGTPLIRVGLSRKARVKSLHNTCTQLPSLPSH